MALSLLGVASLFLLFGGLDHPQAVPFQLVGFGFGASLVALFAQLGGGIYTKAADVGADLVGKVEAGIPEDDPRNPAVIADLVGDNVGDCAGRGADIFESTAAENVGAMILGAALYPVFGLKGILFPLIILAINLIASIIGVFVVSTNETEDPMHALNRGFYLTSVLALAGFAGAVYTMLNGTGVNPIWLLRLRRRRPGHRIPLRLDHAVLHRGQVPAGHVHREGLAHRPRDQHHQRPRRRHGDARDAGRRHLRRAAAQLLLRRTGLAGVDSVGNFAKGIYGTAIATMGMLSCAAYILAMDTFGPITDNAGGIIEMSEHEDAVRDRTDKLDSAGNTTKALTKGYAIGSASLAAFLLFSAYLEEIKSLVVDKLHAADAAGLITSMPINWSFNNINLAQIPCLRRGRCWARMLTYLFSFTGDQSGGPYRADGGAGCARPVPREPGHHGWNLETGLCAMRQHRDDCGAQGDGRFPACWRLGCRSRLGLIFKHFSESFQANASLDSAGDAL